jgi:hypothetical protein
MINGAGKQAIKNTAGAVTISLSQKAVWVMG